MSRPKKKVPGSDALRTIPQDMLEKGKPPVYTFPVDRETKVIAVVDCLDKDLVYHRKGEVLMVEGNPGTRWLYPLESSPDVQRPDVMPPGSEPGESTELM